MKTSYDQAEMKALLAGWFAAIDEGFERGVPLNVVGIRTRGEILAQRLCQALRQKGRAVGFGVLDITLYRDDLSEIGPKALVRPTEIEVDLDGKPLVLVDDVLFTGRSVRAALDALSDFGRPSVIRLAVLVDRKGRELPIQPDFVGLSLSHVAVGERVSVHLEETDGREGIQVEPRSIHAGGAQK